MNRFPVENIDKVEDAINAEVASKLATAKNIKLTGDVTGTASFDGTKDASITATVADDSHNHTIANIDNLQSTLDAKGVKLTVSGKTLNLVDSNDNVLSTVTTQDNNTDTKVTQTVTTTNASYPILAAATASKTATSTEEARFSTGITMNPSTNTIIATTFSGALSGNASTATSATKATQDESGNNIKASYASSMTISGGTITLKSKSGATLSSGTVSVSATSAAKLTTARTIYVKTTAGSATSGTNVVKVISVTGSASFDGSANCTITLPNFIDAYQNCTCDCS